MNKVRQIIRDSRLNADEIAARTRVAPERVTAIANGDPATLAELRALAHGLRIPLHAFIQGEEADSELAMLFRSTSAGRADLGAEAAADFVSAALVVLPKRQVLPNWISQSSLEGEKYEDAARLAHQFREVHFGDRLDDPLLDLPEVLVDLGGLVLGRLDTSRFEGASVVADGYAFIFVSPRFSGRMLFTLAHELGHLLAHHREDRSVVFDTSSQIGGLKHRSKAEAFVDAFASNLLLPERGVAIALREIRASLKVKAGAIGDIEILYLARFYGVSFEVAARRCEDLELLPPGGAYSLSNHLKKTHGSAEKLASALDMPSRPDVTIPAASINLLNAAAEKIKSGEVSLGWVTDRLGCSVDEVYKTRISAEKARGTRH